MKNIFILIILFYSLGAKAQFGLSKGELYEKAIVYFTDGTSEKGLIKRRSFGGIKFRENLDSKPETYDSSNVTGYDDLNTNEKYRYKTVGDFTMLMKIVQLGELNLFVVYKSSGSMPMGMGGANTGMPMMSMGYGGSNVYYIEKNDNTVNIGRKIRKNEWHLFEDCPVLLEKLKQKELSKGAIEDIVDFYNSKCN
ncbi:hypothetical protein AAFN75_04580 [Algibacter sp. AS12]|uniref:hypothetical protein n=1 Tax=Algibacter sp. AS12 TaxID=3135773 RepID=UPI00398A518A